MVIYGHRHHLVLVPGPSVTPSVKKKLLNVRRPLFITFVFVTFVPNRSRPWLKGCDVIPLVELWSFESKLEVHIE